ncbi:hypothetical protein H4R33_004614 [Dimargaris cristalligena]|nr:hypothetical protein H4R33_004614 [Dimargaris cristalligena]
MCLRYSLTVHFPQELLRSSPKMRVFKTVGFILAFISLARASEEYDPEFNFDDYINYPDDLSLSSDNTNTGIDQIEAVLDSTNLNNQPMPMRSLPLLEGDINDTINTGSEVESNPDGRLHQQPEPAEPVCHDNQSVLANKKKLGASDECESSTTAPKRPRKGAESLIEAKRYPCEICDKVYYHPQTLEMHTRLHTATWFVPAYKLDSNDPRE